MYSRIFRRFSGLAGQLSNQYEAGVRSPVSSLLKNPAQNCGRCALGGVRHCRSTQPINKDEIAQKKLDEWLKDPDNEKHYKILQLEVDVHRQNGSPVPTVLKPRHWHELTVLSSRAKRRNYLEFLFGLEKKKENQLEKQRLRTEDREKYQAEQKNKEPTSETWLEYRLGKNSPFLRFYDTTMNHVGNWRLLRAMMYGQKIVMDCGFEHEMTSMERRNCARQMMLSWAVNRDHRDPFDLHFCNFSSEGMIHENFQGFIPTMYDDDFPMNITSKSYLDIFDKNQLVYLTPDCINELKEFDSNAIYIIGAIVDKVSGRPLSMAKAKREGLKMAKLPIDRYLHFGVGGSKSLTLNQMMAILLDAHATNNWEYAFRHVPQRKLFHNRQMQMERRLDRYKKYNEQQASVYSSASPQDFTLKSRNKFRQK